MGCKKTEKRAIVASTTQIYIELEPRGVEEAWYRHR